MPLTKSFHADTFPLRTIPVVKPHAGGYREPRTEFDRDLLRFLKRQRETYLYNVTQHGNCHGHYRMLEFLLEHGRFYEPTPLPKRFRAGKRQACFLNAQLHGTNTPGLTYVEGYAVCSTIHWEWEHAWCVTDEGEFIDLTWTGRRGRRQGVSYFGVPLEAGQISRIICATGVCGPILCDEAFEGPTSHATE